MLGYNKNDKKFKNTKYCVFIVLKQNVQKNLIFL